MKQALLCSSIVQGGGKWRGAIIPSLKSLDLLGQKVSQRFNAFDGGGTIFES
jgi:hypothetical protein